MDAPGIEGRTELDDLVLHVIHVLAPQPPVHVVRAVGLAAHGKRGIVLAAIGRVNVALALLNERGISPGARRGKDHVLARNVA